MSKFLHALQVQRWDDHRYYHHSRINQSLHFISALCFLASYAMLFKYPVAAALVGWLLAMVTRQVGHFFFEPKGFDAVNGATHDHKEEIKLGYNLQRKRILMSVWALSPVALYFFPTLGGAIAPYATLPDYIESLATLWIAIGAGALLFRTTQLFFIHDVQTGLVWITKILTDPFHDLVLYHKAPLHLARGELMDPMTVEHAAPDAPGR